MFYKTMTANSLIFCRMILYYGTLFLFIRHTKENLECNKLANPCCVNQYLNEANNSCSECPYGSFGINCKSSCPTGYYGRLCRSICECNVSECHHVTGCETTNDTNSGTISIKSVTAQTELLQLSTIANVTGEVSTYQDTKLRVVDRHIHTEDDHTSPVPSIWFILLGSLSSLCIIGCILFIPSQKKKLTFIGTQRFSGIRRVFLSCFNQDPQQELIQESEDIELSNVNRTRVCGQEEDDSPYSEIRYSQFIGGANTVGACMNTSLCVMHDSDIHHDKSEKQNIYQKSMINNEYDHVNLKVKSSDIGSDRNLSVPHSNDEEYVSLMNKPSLRNEVRPTDGSKCHNVTLPKTKMSDCNKMGEKESKPQCQLTGNSLQLEFKQEVDKDISENTKHHSVAADRQLDPQSDDRPYSLAEGLSENDLSETGFPENDLSETDHRHSETEAQPNLSKLNFSENLNLSENDLSEALDDSVNSINIDIPGKKEDTSRVGNNCQSNTGPYSFAKIP
ncbi:uncharacterized protein [Magallana gigas]|uniref:uncharacterized protein isoform X1 n=1 Tax=Magallana gigas TaxID=29159 RepID=UPI00334105D7